jgi:hypothetical protein
MSAKRLLLFLVPLWLGACADDSGLTQDDVLLGVSMTSVQGVVRDASTGEPLAGALVQLVDRSSQEAEARVFTNAAGRFRAESADRMEDIRVDVSHSAVIVPDYPVSPFPAYAIRRMAARAELDVQLVPRALLVLNLHAAEAMDPADRLEITINGGPPLLYTGEAPDRKFAGVDAGDVQVSWAVTRADGGRRSGERLVTCLEFGATEMDVDY